MPYDDLEGFSIVTFIINCYCKCKSVQDLSKTNSMNLPNNPCYQRLIFCFSQLSTYKNSRQPICTLPIHFISQNYKLFRQKLINRYTATNNNS